MCSSLRRSGGTGAGACIRRSCACWFIGNAITSRMLLSPAMSMTIRSMPGAEPLAELVPHLPRKPVGRGTLLADEEERVAVDRLGRRAEPAEVRRVEEFRDRPPRPALRERHVAETWRALGARPLSQLVEEAAGLRHPLGRAHGADDRAPGDRGREHREPRVTEGRSRNSST